VICVGSLMVIGAVIAPAAKMFTQLKHWMNVTSGLSKSSSSHHNDSLDMCMLVFFMNDLHDGLLDNDCDTVN